MFNQRGFASQILIWVVIGLIAIVAVSKTGSDDKGLSKIPNNQVVDQQSTKTTVQPNPTGDPQVLADIVKQYYSNISARQFDRAWGLLSKNFQNYSQGYDHFVKGHDTTKSILVQDTYVQGLSANTVFIKLQATDNINNQIQTRNYSGTWKLIFEDGSWKLDTAEIALVSIFPSQAPKQGVAGQPQVYYDDPISDPSNETFYDFNNPQTISIPADNNQPSDSESNKSLKYNPYNSTWEYAGDDESLKYNAFEKQWEYAADDERTQYNSFEKEWEYAKDDENLKYNAFEKTWEYAENDSTTKYNPYESKWEIADPDSELKYNPFSRTWGYE